MMQVTVDQTFASIYAVSVHVGRSLYDQLILPRMPRQVACRFACASKLRLAYPPHTSPLALATKPFPLTHPDARTCAKILNPREQVHKFKARTQGLKPKPMPAPTPQVHARATPVGRWARRAAIVMQPCVLRAAAVLLVRMLFKAGNDANCAAQAIVVAP